MRRCLWVVMVIAACQPQPPRGPDIGARLAGEEGCTGTQATRALPVPASDGQDPASAFMGFRDGAGFHGATFLCDLPGRIIAAAAKQGVENGKLRIDGNVWSIPRVGAQASPEAVIEPVAIVRDSAGCKKELMGCRYETTSPSITRIDTHGPQWVETSGWIHGVEDLCRALPDDTFATCSTRTRMAYVEIGCPSAAAPLQLGIHEAAKDRAYDLDVEVPSARLYGGVDPASEGSSWTYRFSGGGRTAVLAFDLGANPTATLELDGKPEPCIAFGLYREQRR
jgi:hypothetical protein